MNPPAPLLSAYMCLRAPTIARTWGFKQRYRVIEWDGDRSAKNPAPARSQSAHATSWTRPSVSMSGEGFERRLLPDMQR